MRIASKRGNGLEPETKTKPELVMYTSVNFKTKKQVREAIASGRKIEVYQPNGDLTGTVAPTNGTVYLEGPHYPEPHRWYAQGQVKDGYLVSIK